jgi:hypothetical protein
LPIGNHNDVVSSHPPGIAACPASIDCKHEFSHGRSLASVVSSGMEKAVVVMVKVPCPGRPLARMMTGFRVSQGLWLITAQGFGRFTG